jgi:hypothetical protein
MMGVEKSGTMMVSETKKLVVVVAQAKPKKKYSLLG